jgi:hypothetical protein
MYQRCHPRKLPEHPTSEAELRFDHEVHKVVGH